MAKTLFIIALTATFAVLESSAGDYCRIRSCKKKDPPAQHTICKYGFLRVDYNNCGRLKSASLTPREISEILDAHNKYRQIVASGAEHRGNPGPQPAATNLGPLKWDPEIARIAQSWADQCAYGHDKCRDVERFRVGQNIARIGTAKGYSHSWLRLVNMWYDEVADFDRDAVKFFVGQNPRNPEKKIRHYTQMMWANTKLLGCGGVRYHDGLYYRMYLVCNYGPTGNIFDQEMYKTH